MAVKNNKSQLTEQAAFLFNPLIITEIRRKEFNEGMGDSDSDSDSDMYHISFYYQISKAVIRHDLRFFKETQAVLSCQPVFRLLETAFSSLNRIRIKNMAERGDRRAMLIFGEVSPKSIAKEAPEGFAMFSAPLLKGLARLLTSANFLFKQSKKGVVPSI